MFTSSGEILPIEDKELLVSVKAILKDITLGRGKQALIKTDEVLKYQVDDEVTGRMRNARLKIERDELQAAGGVIIRVIRMLEKKMGIENQTSGISINNRELNAKLLYILEDLENFATKEALEKCKELKNYVLPENILFSMEKVIEDIANYDDDEAERLIKAMIGHVSDD